MVTKTLLPLHEPSRLKSIDIAIREQMSDHRDGLDVLATILDPMNCPETMLPWLAAILRPPFWSETMTVFDKRRALANAKEMRRHKGTSYAIRLAMAAVGLDARVEQWYEYSGTPGNFRVVVDTVGAEYSDASLQLADELIESVKRASARLDEIQVQATVDPAQLYIGGFVHIYEKVEI